MFVMFYMSKNDISFLPPLRPQNPARCFGDQSMSGWISGGSFSAAHSAETPNGTKSSSLLRSAMGFVNWLENEGELYSITFSHFTKNLYLHVFTPCRYSML